MSVEPLFRSIGIDRDYEKFNFDGMSQDIQGWSSDHPFFEYVISERKPAVICEVGTWKGASAIQMFNLSKKYDLNTEIICVDTWLGSNDTLWINAEYRKSLQLVAGYPNMFKQFVFNIKSVGADTSIYPLPMTSTSAAYLLTRLKISADVIYIDAGHEEGEVALDLELYYKILKPGGVMFGDDYVSGWPGVIRAVNRFCADRSLMLTSSAGKWLLTKPKAD